jgi:D-sedoheptulose 7-phosphate isomerase/D-glycero-D-manno-heptose 1,7-bisphosphate phosphatase
LITTNYIEQIKNHLSCYDHKVVDKAFNLISKQHSRGGWVFLAGNGGSQSIVEHFATDWSKGIYQVTGKAVKTFVLNSSASFTSAVSNDISFEESISFPLSMLGNSSDLLVLVSSSGKSPNIIKAYELAKDLGIETIALSGFGSESKLLDASVSINVNSKDYQVIEDVHAVFGHLVLKHFFNLLEL